MTERERITRVSAGTTQGGQPVAHLFSHDTRLKYPALVLFDMAELLTVGIDPNTLQGADAPTHCNLWAHYQISEKLNQHGIPYKDVIMLEPIDAPATTTSVDTSALLGELRAIKALLMQLVTPDVDVDAPSDTNDADQTRAARLAKLTQVRTHGTINGPLDTHATDPTHVLEHLTPPEAEPELTARQAREEFYQLVGQAMPDRITPAQVNDLVRQANGGGWPAALAELKEKLQ